MVVGNVGSKIERLCQFSTGEQVLISQQVSLC